MGVLTGADGQLKFSNKVIGKVRDWSLTIQKDALEDTCLGDFDRSYVEGLRGTTGSATVLYDPANDSAVDMLNTILDNNQPENTIEFVLFKDTNSFSCSGFLTNVSPSVAVGSAQAVSVSFQVCNKPIGGF